RERVGPEDREALAVSCADVEKRGSAVSLHHHAVVAVERWQSSHPRSLQHRWRDRVRIRRGLHKHRSATATTLRVRNTLPVLDAPIDVEDRAIAPLRIAGLRRKEIPIVLMSAGPREAIDARAAAEHLAHVERHRTPSEVRIRLRDELPIALGADVFDPTMRV